MAMVKIDKENEDNFKEKNFDPLPKGIYRFQVGHKLAITKCKPPSTNNKIALELTCVDDANDGEFLGRKIFDNLILSPKSEWKLNAFAMSSGLYTKESLQADGEIDTDDFVPDDYEVVASIDVEPYTKPGTTETKMKNVVKAYVFKDAD